VGGSDFYQRCVAEKLYTFGLYRSFVPNEGCALDALLAPPEDGSGAPRTLHDLAVDAFLLSLHQTEAP
jgi:hypothetical protein